MSRFIEFDGKFTINADFIQRIVAESNHGVIVCMANGSSFPVKGTWEEVMARVLGQTAQDQGTPQRCPSCLNNVQS